MAKKDVEIRFTTPGANKVFSAFDNLTKKEQAAIVAGSKLGKQWENAAKKAQDVGKKGTTAFDGITNRIRANIDLVSIWSKAVQAAGNEWERIQRRQKKSQEQQQTFEGAVGNFIINNQQAVQKDPKLLETVKTFAQREGLGLGTGGQADVVQAITQVRSKAGEGFTLQQQLGAIKEAIQAKIIDPSVELGELASANLRTQKALGINQTKAQNVLAAFGPKAGGDVLSFVEEFGKLQGQTAAIRTVEKRQFGEARTDFADLLALEGIISQAMGLDAKDTSTIVQSLTSKIGGARVGRKGIGFEAEGTVERILELAERVIGGEFGEGAKRTQVLTTAGLKGAKGISTLASLLENRELLEQARKDIRAASQADFSIQERSMAMLSETRLDQIEKQQRIGRAELRELEDVKAGMVSREIETGKREEEAFDIGFIDRRKLDVQEFYARIGLISPETLRLERERIINQKLLREEGGNELFNIAIDTIKALKDDDKTPDTGGQ